MNNLSTRQVAISGLLGAVAIILGITPLGFIPVPTPAGHATIMHVPAILGGVLEGPVVGGLVGLIFGIYSFIRATSPLFADPVIAILPRILIGVVSYYTYKCTRSSIAAAVAGSLTNSVGVMGLVAVKGYLPAAVAAGVVATHGIPETVVGSILTVLLVNGIKRVRG